MAVNFFDPACLEVVAKLMAHPVLLPQLPQKMVLASKVVKIGTKIIISNRESKSVTHSVAVRRITITIKQKLSYSSKY